MESNARLVLGPCPAGIQNCGIVGPHTHEGATTAVDVYKDAAALDIIRRDVADLKATVQNLIDLVEPIKDELTPMLDQLQQSTMFKMLVGGK